MMGFWRAMREMPVVSNFQMCSKTVLQRPFVVVGEEPDVGWVARLMAHCGDVETSSPLLLSVPTQMILEYLRFGQPGLRAPTLRAPTRPAP